MIPPSFIHHSVTMWAATRKDCCGCVQRWVLRWVGLLLSLDKLRADWVHWGHTLPALIKLLTTHLYLRQNILSYLKYAILRYSPSRIRRPEKSEERATEPFRL